MNSINLVTRLRFLQIRLFAKLVERLAPTSHPSRVLTALGKNSLIDRSLSGFRRTFPTFAAARRHAATYRVPSHEHPGNIAVHTYRTQEIRPSDYPMLFHMQRLMDEATSVLDIGGSIGNLFYSYSHLLPFPPDMTWTVLELPDVIAAGSRIAQQKKENRLRFVERVEDCRPVDLVVISGSLHYFEELPPDLIRELRHQPRHIFINRTPVVDGPSAITIQDHEQYFALSPARILSREVLMRAMSEAGYELVDEWKAPELRLVIPLHPESSVSSYSGFYFRKKGAEAGRSMRSGRAAANQPGPMVVPNRVPNTVIPAHLRQKGAPPKGRPAPIPN